MRLHLVSLPHTQATRSSDWCAYTAKVRRFSDEMTRRGHEVVLYGPEEADCARYELVPLSTAEERAAWWPGWSPEREQWAGWDQGTPWWETTNLRAVAEIGARRSGEDVLCVTAGVCQEMIARAFPAMPCVEWGVGYEGVFSEHRVYESWAWRHHVAGLRGERDLRLGDAVIPNGYFPDELQFSTEKDDYLLFVGRRIERKGVAAALALARSTGRRLIMAGQGNLDGFDTSGVDLDLRGLVLGDEKAKLLARASALLCPTIYLEPFGGVACEAMLSGTPVLASAWGAFTETVTHGVSGFLCSSGDDWLRGAEMARELEPELVRASAQRFTMAATGELYERFLSRLTLSP
jgi:glycosyltransferase involved in cell wall biosynthesis